MTDEEIIAWINEAGDAWQALDQAGDRIEALVKERDEALNQLDSARHSVEVLEKRVAHFMALNARLKAQVKAAFHEGFLAGKEDGWVNNPRIESEWKQSRARAALTEIEGKKK